MTAATDKQWRIQYRKNRTSPWKVRPGLFETREVARGHAAEMRWFGSVTPHGKPCGFGNTRVIPYVKAVK